MTTSLSFASTTPRLKSHHHHSIIFTPNYNGKLNRIRCNGERPTSNSSSPKQESEPENALLKVAWYSSELLGIAASFFRSPSNSSTEASEKDIKLGKDVSGAIDRAVVVETIKEDFQKSYFVTGFLKFTFQSLSLSLYPLAWFLFKLFPDEKASTSISRVFTRIYAYHVIYTEVFLVSKSVVATFRPTGIYK